MSDIEEYATEYPFDTGYQWIEQIEAENAALRERVAELEAACKKALNVIDNEGYHSKIRLIETHQILEDILREVK